jgi:hypothetical protein
MYNITVLTLISQGNKPHARDELVLYGVGESVKEFMADSCRMTLYKLMKLPECLDEDAWHLKYRTVVMEAGTERIVSDTKLITFPAMTLDAMQDFKQWAVQELKATIAAVDAERAGQASSTNVRRRSWIMTIIRILRERFNV